MSHQTTPQKASPVPAKRLSNRNSSSTQLRGLYRRGQVWWWNSQNEGHRTRLSLDTTDYATAVKKVLEYRTQPQLIEAGKWEFEVRKYLAEQRARGRLSAGYSDNRLYTLLKFSKENDIEAPREATTAVIQRWYNGLKATNAHTAYHYVQHIRTFLAHLVESNKLRDNPSKKVLLDKTVQPTRDIFVPKEDVARLIDEAPDDELRLIMLLGFECGMRKQEIVSARPSWLDMKAGTLTIPAMEEGFIRKNRKSTTIPMTDRVKAFFARGSWKGPYLLRPKQKPGKWRYRYEFRKSFTAFMKEKELGHITAHDMRRSFASNRVSAGVSIEKVANWLGDSIQVAWKNYSRFLPVDSDINRGAA